MFRWWYEVEQQDDHSSLIVMCVSTDSHARLKIGAMPLKFSADMRIMADDLCRTLNKNRESTPQAEKQWPTLAKPTPDSPTVW